MRNRSEKMLAFILVFALVADFAMLNTQLYDRAPKLAPMIDPTLLFGCALLTLGSAYLMSREKYFGTPAWFVGFVLMAALYLPLRWMGLQGDFVDYWVAQANGKTVGGGAAMAHVPMLAYLLGPAQILSAIGLHGTRFLGRVFFPTRPDQLSIPLRF